MRHAWKSWFHSCQTDAARVCARKRVYLCHDARERADISQVAVRTASTSWPESLAHLFATLVPSSNNELTRMTDYYSSIFRHRFLDISNRSIHFRLSTEKYQIDSKKSQSHPPSYDFEAGLRIRLFDRYLIYDT